MPGSKRRSNLAPDRSRCSKSSGSKSPRLPEYCSSPSLPENQEQMDENQSGRRSEPLIERSEHLMRDASSRLRKYHQRLFRHFCMRNPRQSVAFSGSSGWPSPEWECRFAPKRSKSGSKWIQSRTRSDGSEATSWNLWRSPSRLDCQAKSGSLQSCVVSGGGLSSHCPHLGGRSCLA